MRLRNLLAALLLASAVVASYILWRQAQVPDPNFSPLSLPKFTVAHCSFSASTFDYAFSGIMYLYKGVTRMDFSMASVRGQSYSLHLILRPHANIAFAWTDEDAFGFKSSLENFENLYRIDLLARQETRCSAWLWPDPELFEPPMDRPYYDLSDPNAIRDAALRAHLLQ